MRYASVCSGVSPHTKAFSAMDWNAVFFSEIEQFPSAVLAHHYPEVPNLGDMTKIDGREWRGKVDVLLASCPCQAFSVAGLRKSLSDDRGNLTLVFCELVTAIEPRWVVYENVPGILSTPDNAFGCFLAGLVGEDAPLVSKWGWPDAGMVIGPERSAAWRVLDAQYFGLAQRRRRVFVVSGRTGDGTNPGAVLFEPDRLPRHTPPRREAGQGFTHDVAPCIGASGRGFERGGESRGQDPVIALRGEGYDASEDGSGRGTPLVPVAADPINTQIALRHNALGERTGMGIGGIDDPAFTLQAGHEHAVAIAFSAKDHGADAAEDVSPTLRAGGFDKSHANSGNWMAVAFQEAQTGCREYDTAGTLRSNGPGHDPVGTRIRTGMAVRRLTPVECEKLQGWEPNYTNVPYRGKPAADGPRYKAIGNGWAVPCLTWLASRILAAEEGR